MDERDGIDREIDALLDVEPSPDFVARVRARVDGESMTRRGWLTARWLAGAAAIVAALIVVSAMWFDRPAPVLVVREVPPVPIPNAVVEPPSTRAEARPTASAQSPEVLVSPAESALLQRLLVAAREARIEPAPDLQRDAPLNRPMPIVIEPLDVPPLVTADLKLGAQQ
jgi:hypothetical protein